jgi:hypothetical protein
LLLTRTAARSTKVCRDTRRKRHPQPTVEGSKTAELELAQQHGLHFTLPFTLAYQGEVLTASERRIAERAAVGDSNRGRSRSE